MAVQAIRNFVYFTCNYPSPRDMCTQIWGTGCDGDHFFNKLEGYDFDIVRFFLELSIDNQRKFAEWIMQNYDCGWNKYDQPENKPTFEEGANTYILFGENASSWYAEGGVDTLLEHIDEDVFDIRKHCFRDEAEKLSYLKGVEEGQGWEGCIEITEEDCQKIENYV